MKELNWRLVLLGGLLCAVAAAATPYVTLKLGQSVDLTMGGMFLAAYVLGGRVGGQALAIQLNIIQTMIGVVSGIAFMVVILAAFFYIQNVFGRDIGFNPTTWQMFLWLLISANLGVFMGIIPRRSILKDRSLPWPASKATLSVAQTLTDPKATAATKARRDVLMVSTATAGFLTFLRDGLGVITPIVGNAALNISLGPEFAAFGIGMLVPLSVGLSGLLGTWIVSAFGETAAKYAALSGVAPQGFDACLDVLGKVSGLDGAEKAKALDFLAAGCGKAAEFAGASSHFKYVVQWMMWPATAMMVAAALTSVIIPLVQNFLSRGKGPAEEEVRSLADEEIPLWWTATGISVCVALLVWLTSSWFSMSWTEVLLAVAIQPVLIVAGLRVLGITGSGPVSLMANATQFLFGLIWPAQIRSNLAAAYISANPQASSENVVPSFWVAQRLGGRFKTLILAQLIVIPIGALLTPLMFNMLEHTYGIGLNPGQLSAPTGLKIATLAIVMEKGLSFLPRGALHASIVAIAIGVLFELLLAVRRRDARGNDASRFWWVPIPAALGFALILPASLNIGIAVGSVLSAIWHRFSPAEGGSFESYATPLASGLVAGEAMVGSILLPALAMVLEMLPR
ncbi:MAG: OPT/YSL family transporter [Elusimicrobia bacterium]|nr:OPT/YSL family transporter [Elusimicrobiota bacterium]